MADTLPPITNIEDVWINVYSTIDISAGTPLVVQNTGTSTLLLYISEEQPSSNAQGRHLYPLQQETLNIGNSGLWVRNSPKSAGLSRLQADVVGGLDETNVGSNLFPDGLQLQIAPETTQPDTTLELQFTNNTTASIVLEQLVNLEAIPDGATEGTSSISMIIYFNPDITGATLLPTSSKAYANGFDGQFVDITGGGVILAKLDGFNTVLNQFALRVSGGQASFFQTNQNLPSSAVNQNIALTRPFSIAQGQSVVFSVVNSGLVDGGVSAVSSALVSGRFLTLSSRVEVQPENLTYEGDNLTYDGDQLTYK